MNMLATPNSGGVATISNLEAVTTRILNADELLALGSEWEELLNNTLEANAYYCRHYSEALLTHIENRVLKAIAVFRGPRLIALYPFVTDRAHWGGLKAVNKGWTTDYITTSIPLIDQRDAATAANALLTAMGDGSTGSSIWLLPNITLDGDANTALSAEMSKQNINSQVFDTFERAMLKRQGTVAEHMSEHVSKKRRKDLRRNRKRLDELGHVTWSACSGGPELDETVDAFLRIEASGWKGARGTALDCEDATRAFAKQAFGNHGGNPVARADILSLDGKPIAINLTLIAGRTGFTTKCAFDEAYKGQSAGLLLEEEMIRGVLEGDWVDTLDSAAVSGHLVASLWNSTTRVGDVLLDASPNTGSAVFTAFVALETFKRRVRAKLKAIVNKFRR